ncbi:MAG: ATP--guanido phosphotransferase [Eubacteriales bacterium]|nr:ATP--guanido phosphotransferase [Eubacteriales bacterium]
MNKWYCSQGNNSDVVLSSKIRLARNLADAPFPCKMSNEVRKSVCKKIFAAVKNSDIAGEFDMIDMSQTDDLKRISLAEKGVISPEFAKQKMFSSVLVSKDESTSVMLCEEDHIRLTVMSAGQDLENAYKKADEIDDIFIKNLKIAFSERLGFLTSNPMNLGTGLKASLVLHLPAISQKGMMPSLSAMVGKLGFTVKPLFGSNDFFELSNRISLGITEKSAIENLNAICDQIVKQERAFRQELSEYDDFQDKIYRAMGTLKMARKLSTKEFYDLISLVRLGVSMGSFDESYENIGNMLYSLGTATIMSGAEERMTVDEADKLRAQYVREQLK